MAKNSKHHSSEGKKKLKAKSKRSLKSKLKSRLKAKFRKELKRKLKAEKKTKSRKSEIKQPVCNPVRVSRQDLSERESIAAISEDARKNFYKFKFAAENNDIGEELLNVVDENINVSHADFFDEKKFLKMQQSELNDYMSTQSELLEEYNRIIEIRNQYAEKQHECFDKTAQAYLDFTRDMRNINLKNILKVDRCVSEYLEKVAKKGMTKAKKQNQENLSGKNTVSSAVENKQKPDDAGCGMKKSRIEAARKKELLKFIKKEIPSVKSYFMKEKKCFHFDMPVKMETEEDIMAVKDWLNDPDKMACHSFLPLISNEIVSRQKRKIEEFRFYEKTLAETDNPQVMQLCRESIDKFKKNGPVKKRPIRMCSNRDTLVFAHYSRKLGELYEKYIGDLGFSECVLAYRSTPLVEINGVKSSFRTIPAVHDVVQYVRKHNNKCVALAFDMSSFFDCIDHRNLKEEWKKVLGVDELPKDHYNIFKALTRYCFVEHSEIEEYAKYLENLENGENADAGKTTSVKAAAVAAGDTDDEENSADRERISLRKYFSRSSDFRKFRKWYSQNKEYVAHKNFHNNPGLKDKDASYGIPQGLSICAVLSNIYMIPFDRAVSTYAKRRGYLYRRYCDDIMLVGDIDHDDIMKVYKFISKEIGKRGRKLKLHPFIQDFYNPYSKSQIYDFSSPDIKRLPMQYLGFYFDGSEVRIREGSIAGFYRKMDKAVTASYLRTYERIKRRIIKERSTGYLVENKLAKVKLGCVKYYDEDGIAFTGNSLSKKYLDRAKKRMDGRCADKYQAISNDYWYESLINNLVSRFVLTDIDKKTGKVKYRRAFLPNVKRLHRVYSFRANKNFISYAMNAARIFGGSDEKNNVIRKQMRSHSHHLHRKINDAYMKTCFRLKKLVNEAIAKKQEK